MPLPVVEIIKPSQRDEFPIRPAIDSHNSLMAEVAQLAALEAQSAAAREWTASPYAPLRDMKPIPKSRTARAMLVSWLASIHIIATPSNVWGNTALILPGSRLAAVKFSMRWHEGSYRFQQIRDWEYDIALLLGVSPDQAHLWAVPRSVLLAHSAPQHGEYSRMLNFQSNACPGWLRQYGGTLSEAADLLTTTVTDRATATYWSQQQLLPNTQHQAIDEVSNLHHYDLDPTQENQRHKLHLASNFDEVHRAIEFGR